MCASTAAHIGSSADAGGLAFDGDQATATLTITAPSAPFTVRQQSSCTPPPTAGVPTTCTITETVTNNSGHAFRFDTVTNQIPPNVTIAGQSSPKGQIAANGNQVVWRGFKVPSLSMATATVKVTFTPTASQVGQHVRLSAGIHASAVDLVTGQRYGTGYGSLITRVRVIPSSNVPPNLPQTGSGGTAGGASVGALPQTGGGAGTR